MKLSEAIARQAGVENNLIAAVARAHFAHEQHDEAGDLSPRQYLKPLISLSNNAVAVLAVVVHYGDIDHKDIKTEMAEKYAATVLSGRTDAEIMAYTREIETLLTEARAFVETILAFSN